MTEKDRSLKKDPESTVAVVVVAMTEQPRRTLGMRIESNERAHNPTDFEISKNITTLKSGRIKDR